MDGTDGTFTWVLVTVINSRCRLHWAGSFQLPHLDPWIHSGDEVVCNKKIHDDKIKDEHQFWTYLHLNFSSPWESGLFSNMES